MNNKATDAVVQAQMAQPMTRGEFYANVQAIGKDMKDIIDSLALTAKALEAHTQLLTELETAHNMLCGSVETLLIHDLWLLHKTGSIDAEETPSQELNEWIAKRIQEIKEKEAAAPQS